MKTSGSTSSQHLIYHNGKWIDFDDCDQSLIDQIIAHNGAIKIILGQFSEANRGINTYRRILGGLFSDNFKSYNKALLAYSREDGKELKRLAYVRHALPLDANSYPNGWFIKAPQAFCKNTSNHPAKVLVCFTGRSGMMDMSIPCFHSVAYDIFDTVVYIYRPRNNHYSSALDHLRIALGRLCMRLGTQDLYFTGVSAGGTAALWMHLHSVYSKGVMVTSPTLGSIPSLIELLANAGKEYWISARIFLATGNSLDLRSQQLLNSALDHNMLTDCIFNLNWASPSHGSMATLMSLGHLDKQLLWLRERVDGVS